jgi:hypothetical protein
VQVSLHSLVSFSRLQGVTAHLPWDEAQGLPGFRSLTAPSPMRPDVGDSSPHATRPQAFSTSRRIISRLRLVGLFHPTGTPRVPSSGLDHESIGTGLPVLASAPLSASQGFHLPSRDDPISSEPPRHYALGLFAATEAPRRLAPTGSPLRLGPTLKHSSRFGALRDRNRCHPAPTEQPS